MANTAFLDYFDELIYTLKVPVLQNVTMQEHILPIFLDSDDFDKELLEAPETSKQRNFYFDHLAWNVFIFVMAMISLIVAVIVIIILCTGAKMQALLTNLAMQKSVKTVTEGKDNCSNYEYWVILMLLILILIGIMFLIIEKAYRMPLFQKHQYSNIVKVMMFVSNIESYVPFKLSKVTDSIHLFKLTGKVQKENITLHRNKAWDILEIDWKNVTLTVNRNVFNLPGSVIIPFQDKFKVRQMMRSKPFVVAFNAETGTNMVSFV